MYHRNNSQVRNLVDSTDLHILHSMNPDGFERAEQACNGTIGRTNADNVSFDFKIKITQSLTLYTYVSYKIYFRWI